MPTPAHLRPWKLHRPDPPRSRDLAAALGVSPVVGQLLVNRGFADAAAAREWLDAPLTGVPPPEALAGATEAGKVLWESVRTGRRVCVYGDYDVDGTTGASILLKTLKKLGAERPMVYLPHRFEEGYGVNAAAVRKIAKAGFGTLVTVDCGITATAEVEVAKAAGLTVVVTDHHSPKDELPAASVLAHPALPGQTGPPGLLCGAGVAYKVAWATVRAAHGGRTPDDWRDHLARCRALAAFGTVADVVPLVGENRAIVRHGLARTVQADDAATAAILSVCGLAGKPILASDVGFKIGPRINAAGRLGMAGRVIDLLAGDPAPEEAARIAGHLDYCNSLRQRLERQIVEEARAQAVIQVDAGRAGVVVAGADWHPGVVGIVASRLTDRFQRPALVVSFGTRTGVGYGSGRSPSGMPLHLALRACDPALLSHGGHAAAAGFKVGPDHYEQLQVMFWEHCAAHYGGPPPPAPLLVEAEAKLADLDLQLIADLKRLEPHGAGNPAPLFVVKGCRVESAKTMGKTGEHLSLSLSQPGRPAKPTRCVAWSMAERVSDAVGFLDVIGVPQVNEWMGRRSVELEVKAFRQAVPPSAW